jgi:hypothetical protein
MSEECEQFQEEVDRISEELRTNEQELFQAEARVNEIDQRLQEMHNAYYERYYSVPAGERWKIEFEGDEIMMEELRSELEAATNLMYSLWDLRELLASELERAMDELACCEMQSCRMGG